MTALRRRRLRSDEFAVTNLLAHRAGACPSITSAAQLGDTVADARQSILGEIHQGGTGGLDREPSEGRGAGGDRDGEIKTKP